MSNQAGNLAKGVPITRIEPLPERRWARRAACLGHNPDLWFLDDQAGSYREARTICQSCPVRQQCLDWALETHTDHGMWGGLNPLQRKTLRRPRQLDLTDDHQRFDEIRPTARFL